MRKVILILICSFLVSCTKEWNCTITTHTTYLGTTYTSVTNTTFHGTTAEKNDFEESAIQGQTVECN